MKFTPNEDNDRKTSSFEYDEKQINEILTGDFQYLEDMFAWRGNISRINWQSATLEYREVKRGQHYGSTTVHSPEDSKFGDRSPIKLHRNSMLTIGVKRAV